MLNTAIDLLGQPAPIASALLVYAAASSKPPAGISGWRVSIWFFGVVLVSLRGAGGWMLVQKLKREKARRARYRSLRRGPSNTPVPWRDGQIPDRIPGPPVAATGGDLRRIRRALGRQNHAPPPFGLIAGAALALLIATSTAIVSLNAAPQEGQPAFDVASVKRDVSGQPGPQYRIFPGFTVQRATLKNLVTMAYEVHDFQVSGGPGWISSERYDIEAKGGVPPAFSQEYRMLQLRRLQTLLKDRFKLALHRETKKLPVYELSVAKGGPKLEGPICIERQPGDLTIAPGKTVMDYCGFGGFSRRGEYQASNGSMGDLAGALSFVLGRTVVDKTGITGRYRIQLKFARDASIVPFPDLGGSADAAPLADLGPDIFTALPEQLGLKLKSSKGPVEVLIIDYAERPSEN